MQDKSQLFMSTIQEADLILVGIGKEFSGFDDEVKKAYLKLEKLLKDKNYFVITTNMDGEITRSNLDQAKVVQPCGNYYNLQCSEGCHDSIYPLTIEEQENVRSILMKKGEVPRINKKDCPNCGKALTYNIVTEVNYIEAGYLPQWETYTKWLQSTLNRNLFVLELGVGLKMPSVIRWPFEKITYFNQKSVFFRIHSSLYQMEEKLSERGISIKENPISFLNRL